MGPSTDRVALGAENVRFFDNSIGRYGIDPQAAPLILNNPTGLGLLARAFPEPMEAYGFGT